MTGRRRFLGTVRPLICAVLALVCTGAAWADPELEQKVREALRRNLDFNSQTMQGGTDMKVLSPATSLPHGATLRVVAVRTSGDPATSVIRLQCASPVDCLPFFVLVRGHIDVHRESSHPVNDAVAHTGDRVDVVERLSGLQLRTRGVCLQPGAIGDRVRVRNLATHRIFLATIRQDHVVEVEP